MYAFTEYLCLVLGVSFVISCAWDLFQWAQCKDLEEKDDRAN